MTKSAAAGSPASVRQRLLNLAHARNEEFQFVLVRYALERLLYRIRLSRYHDQFILKGAILFQYWTGQPHRSTLDLDLLGKGDPAPQRLQTIFREICTLPSLQDGLIFLPDTIRAEAIRENQHYGGVRVCGTALLGTANIPLQIDVGFGDAVTPAPHDIQCPSLLGFPTALFPAYPRETVIAEKFEAMVTLGVANTRMKDFFDVWLLSESFDFRGESLGGAIHATFHRRETPLPRDVPAPLTSAFSDHPSKRAQWKAFTRRGNLNHKVPALEHLTTALRDFLWPPVASLAGGTDFSQATWLPSGPWKLNIP